MSTSIPDAELEAIAKDLEDEVMPNVATILKRALTPDGQGGKEEAYVPRAEGVECGLAPLKARAGNAEDVAGGRPSATSRWLFTFPVGTVIKATDVVDLEGARYRVETVRGPRGKFTLTVRAEAVQIDVGGTD